MLDQFAEYVPLLIHPSPGMHAPDDFGESFHGHRVIAKTGCLG